MEAAIEARDQAKAARQEIEHTNSISTQAVVEFRRANTMRADHLLVLEAAMRNPQLLATLADRPTINKTRRLQLEHAIENGEPDPRSKRNDDITRRISIPVPFSGGKKYRLTKRDIVTITTLVATLVHQVLAHYGIHL